jgi:membrane-associated phospholipid phosphatase
MPHFVTDLDARILRYFYAAGAGGLTTLALALSAIGSGWLLIGLIPLIQLPRFRRFASWLGGAVGATALLVVLLKAIIGRLRPCYALADVHARCSPPTDPSFPSGHACGIFTFAAFVLFVMYTSREIEGRVRLALTPLLVGLAVGVAWSRVYLGVHFPGDVAAGALLGAWGGTLAGWLYRRPERVLFASGR